MRRIHDFGIRTYLEGVGEMKLTHSTRCDPPATIQKYNRGELLNTHTHTLKIGPIAFSKDRTNTLCIRNN